MRARSAYIVGPPRSGTTLLSQLLAGCDGTLSLSEPYLGYGLLPHWKLCRFFRNLERSGGLARVRPPLPGNPSQFGRYLERLAEASGCHTVVVKETFRVYPAEPRWENAPLLDELVTSGAPVVALIRHPYDTAASTLRLFSWLKGFRGLLLRYRRPGLPYFRDDVALIEWYAKNWTAYVQWSRSRGLRLLRYEDFVSGAESQMRALCASFGLAFHGGLLTPEKPPARFGGFGDPDTIWRLPRAVSTKSIGQAGQLSQQERLIIRAHCERTAGELGYELNEPATSGRASPRRNGLGKDLRWAYSVWVQRKRRLRLIGRGPS